MKKIKGISIWEQNAEFFALGIAALALIAFVAMQLIGQPNAVEVAGHGTITPDDVDQRLIESAERFDAMLSPSASPQVPIGDSQPVLPEFEMALAAGVSPPAPIGSLVAGVPVTIGERVRVGDTFTVPEVPAPTAAVARQFFDTLDEAVVDQYGLQSRFESTPYDTTWVTAAAAIDLDAVVASYGNSGPDGSLAPVPTSWHANHATILDIRVERQEQVDGQWVNSTILDPLPGQETYRDEIQNGVGATQREAIVRAARDLERQRLIAQPPFYPTRNSSFLPPDPNEPEIELIAAGDDELVQVLRRLRRLEQERESLRKRLEELGGPVKGSGGSGTGTGGGGRTPGSGSGSSGPGGPPPPPIQGGGLGVGNRGAGNTGEGTTNGKATEEARNTLTKRIERLNREIADLQAQVPADETPTLDSASNAGEYLVWAHDMDVTPGRTYRYRIIVDIYNPFYLRRNNLVDEQQELCDSMVMSSPVSEWSEPIRAQAPLHPFITRAYAPGQDRGSVSEDGMGHVVAEVYRFYDGKWWHSQFNLEPGERIGGVVNEDGREIDYGTDWFVLDIIEDAEVDDGSQGPGREGRSARVVLQHIESGEITEIRHPNADMDDPNRMRLEDEVQFAGLG